MKALSKFLTPLTLHGLLLDVNSWLVTFGFHLHNAIPGFPVPKFHLTEPSYELEKSQQWDDVPVRTGSRAKGRQRGGVLASCLPASRGTAPVKTLPETAPLFLSVSFPCHFWGRKTDSSTALLFSMPGAC